MKKCLLVVNGKKDDALALADRIAGELKTHGIDSDALMFPVETQTAIQVPKDFSRYDFAVTLGGDGTVLFAARLCAPFGIPILPVNLGSFGFICGIDKETWQEEIVAFLNGKTDIHERSMAEAAIQRGKNIIATSSALNDIVITSKNVPRILTLNVFCNGISFGQFKSDALIFSTATGSTAYSAAAGGPIIDPSLDVIVLTPICPFSLSSRPLVLSSSSEIHVTQPDFFQDVQVLADGQPLCSIERGDTIIVRKSKYVARLHAGSSSRFYATLHSKMNWSGGPVA
jgi:NAD+ kinase